MRIFTLSMIAVMTMAGTMTAATKDYAGKYFMPKKTVDVKSADANTPAAILQNMRKAEAQVTKYRAGKENVYAWDGEDWQFDATYTMEYDKAGQVETEVMVDFDGYYLRTSYNYDANGMVTSKLEEVSEDGETYFNSSKTERQYDPIVTNLITSNREYMWLGDEWVLNGNNYNREVTRNADGNVTKVEVAVWYDGTFDPMDRIEVTYGSDGKATSMKESILNYDGISFYWEEGTMFSNIIWDRTDGQIVSMEEYGLGANRIKSCDITVEEETAHMDIAYDGNDFTATMTGVMDGEETESVIVYEELDEYGSYTQSQTTTYTFDDETYTEEEIYVLRYDAYGNMLESKDMAIYDGFEEIYEDIQGTVEYDSAFGFPVTYILTASYFDYELEEYLTENLQKVEFSDYVGIVSKVSDIDASQAEEESFYTLQGVKVAHPSAGNIYIRKQGGKTSKVIVK